MCTSCITGYTTWAGRAARGLWAFADRVGALLAAWSPATWAVDTTRRGRAGQETLDAPTASAALLLEVVETGGRVTDGDRGRVTCTLAAQFGLSPRGADRVVRHAERARRNAPGLQAFTGPLVGAFTRGQREILAGILEELARDAGRTGWEEHYPVRKIRALLRVEVARV